MDNDKEKLEREAAKILFSAPAKVEEDVARAQAQGPQIPFVCPFCNEAYPVSAELAGKTISCRNCREPSRVGAKKISPPVANRQNLWPGVVIGVVLTLIAVVLLKLAGLL
jgi:hypothetical protein